MLFLTHAPSVLGFLLQESRPWYDYPGLELWKFINLAVLCAAIIFVVRKWVAPALETRRKTIKLELEKTKLERDAAQAKLVEVESRLLQLDSEVAVIKEQARLEGEREVERILRSADEDARKLIEQARREIDSAGKVARKELRQFAAEESVRIAEQLIRSEIKPVDDSKLIEMEISELGVSLK